jgi:protein-disulfide isomerase
VKVEEFEKTRKNELRQKANECFDKSETTGSLDKPGPLLEAKFYLDEIERRQQTSTTNRRRSHSGYTRGVSTGSLKFALLVLTYFFFVEVGSAQIGAPKSKQPVATIDGKAIYDDDLFPSIQGQLFPLRNQEYEIKKRALDTLIEQKLLEDLASKKGIPTEKLLEQEVDSKVQEPSDAEVQAYYLAQKDRLNRPYDEIKPQLAQALKQAKVQQARLDYIKRLRSGNEVVVLLSPPKMQMGYDPARVRGNPKAPVMIVEFSDFQCPYCHQVEPVVKDLLAKYGDKVSLAYRDLPLKQIHPQAEIAAEASRCAGEQGKYWDYHDQLFNASKLDRDALLEYARNLKLDDKRFDSCLTTGKYRADVEKDSREGMQAGITGTPAFFINGVVLSGAEPKESFARIIDQELVQKR